MRENKIRITTEHLENDGTDRVHQDLINKINHTKFFHMYPQAKMILFQELFPLFHEAIYNSSTRGMVHFLYGDQHTGKTYLLEFMKEYICYNNGDLWKSNRHPIILLDLSDKISEAQDFYLHLLAELECPITRMKEWKATKSITINLRKRLISTLEQFQTRILVLDECQRILEAKPQNIPSIFEAIKDLTNKKYWNGELRTQFVLCGTNKAYGILEAANWIQGRTFTLQLESLSKKEYSKFLVKIYNTYVTLGITDSWSLLSPDSRGNIVLNGKLVKYLFKRTEPSIIRKNTKSTIYRVLNRSNFGTDVKGLLRKSGSGRPRYKLYEIDPERKVTFLDPQFHESILFFETPEEPDKEECWRKFLALKRNVAFVNGLINTWRTSFKDLSCILPDLPTKDQFFGELNRYLDEFPERVCQKRRGFKESTKKFRNVTGATPGTKYIGQVCEIDHTPCDVIGIVPLSIFYEMKKKDKRYKIRNQFMKKAIITTLMDLHTRVIIGDMKSMVILRGSDLLPII